MAALRPHLETLKVAGVDVAVVGSGAPNFVAGFRNKVGLDIAVYCDEKVESYRLLGMVRGVRTLLHPGVVWRGALAILQCNWQTATHGVPLQQGGAIVVRPDGEMTYCYLSRYMGDHPNTKKMIAAALKAA